MTKMKKDMNCDIIIAGGGTPGLALALILARHGLHAAIINPFTPKPLSTLSPGGRTVALLNSSWNVLHEAGLNGAEDLYGCPLNAMRIIDDSVHGDESVWADFPASDIGCDHYGHNIDNAVLTSALYELAEKQSRITRLMDHKLHDYTPSQSGVTARTECGQIIHAKVIIGADGRKSTVRGCAGISVWEKEYGQSAITCLINHSRSHNNIATEFHRPGGPLALVPLTGNQSAIVWVEKHNRAEDIIKLKKQDFLNILQHATKDILGAITLETAPEMWPLKTLKAKKLIAPRCALIAEAAHVMSPITAQGLNLSLRDVAALTEIIIDAARLGLDYGSQTILQQYETRRNLDLNSRISGVDKMMSIVSTDMVPVKKLRRAGFKILDRADHLRKVATAQALAPDLDKGRIVSGKPL